METEEQRVSPAHDSLLLSGRVTPLTRYQGYPSTGTRGDDPTQYTDMTDQLSTRLSETRWTGERKSRLGPGPNTPGVRVGVVRVEFDLLSEEARVCRPHSCAPALLWVWLLGTEGNREHNQGKYDDISWRVLTY